MVACCRACYRYVDKKCRQLVVHAEGTGGMSELKLALQPGMVGFGGFRVYVSPVSLSLHARQAHTPPSRAIYSRVPISATA
jgi:hypothetical protein